MLNNAPGPFRDPNKRDIGGGYLKMGNAWITDLQHFLTEDGSRADMPNRTRRLVDYLGSIVKKVSTHRGDGLATGVRCRKKFRQRPCPGEIIAFIDNRHAVAWLCPVC